MLSGVEEISITDITEEYAQDYEENTGTDFVDHMGGWDSDSTVIISGPARIFNSKENYFLTIQVSNEHIHYTDEFSYSFVYALEFWTDAN